MKISEDDMAWAIAEARKVLEAPKPKTRAFSEWRAELRAKRDALSPTDGADSAPPKVRHINPNPDTAKGRTP